MIFIFHTDSRRINTNSVLSYEPTEVDEKYYIQLILIDGEILDWVYATEALRDAALSTIDLLVSTQKV